MTVPDSQQLDDLLDLGIVTAFGMSAARSPADAIAAPEPPEFALQAETLADLPKVVGKYEVEAVMAQGGMGIVVRAHDRELDREVAIKFLRRSLSSNPGLQRLFADEARVMGGLQHPGIVPVHDYGKTEDGRLYYVMKLVAGESLHAALHVSAGAAKDRRQLLLIFARVCETMAFAHSRGVVHGDLKPANVMVGAFGEVQIFDWGFARAAQLAVHAERDAAAPRPRVLGTPAYMAPEQARGTTEAIDARTDVFALGGMLCEILTGVPPYRGQTREEVFLRASRAWLDDAYRRLDACGADKALVVLAHRCLAPEPIARPADAGAVAAATHAHLAAIEQRAHDLAIEAAEARARAEQERKARRATLALSIVIVAALLAGAVALLWYERRESALRTDAEQRAHAALARLTELRDRARAAPDDKARLWGEATAVARETEQFARAPHVGPDLSQRLLALRQEVETQSEVELRDARASALLDEIRPHRGEDRPAPAMDADHKALLAEFGVDLDAGTPAQIGAAIRPSPLAPQIAAALHHFAHLRRPRAGGDDARWRRLLELADHIDPDPWRTELRRRCALRDGGALRALAAQPDLATVAGTGLGMLAECVAAAGDRAAAVRVYRLAHLHAPDDYGTAHDLGVLLGGEPAPPRAEITRLFSVAAALRPRSAHALVDLALALFEQGDTAAARTVAERARTVDPDYRRAWTALISIRGIVGDRQGAVAAARQLLRLQPGAEAQIFLADTLSRAGAPDEALAACQTAVELAPRSAAAHRALGTMQMEVGAIEAAIATLRHATTLAEDDAESWYHLGLALQRAGIDGEAEAAYRRALTLAADHAETHCNLGALLGRRGDFTAAIAAVRRGAELGQDRLGWSYPTDQWIADLERRAAGLPELDRIAAGGPLPDDGEESLALAQLALARGDALLAFKLFDHARGLGQTMPGAAYLDLVRAAARVLGTAAAEPQVRARASQAALAMLVGALDSMDMALASDPAAVIPVRGELSQWRLAVDLEPIRLADRRAALPAEDRTAWGELWDRVHALYAAQELR